MTYTCPPNALVPADAAVPIIIRTNEIIITSASALASDPMRGSLSLSPSAKEQSRWGGGGDVGGAFQARHTKGRPPGPILQASTKFPKVYANVSVIAGAEIAPWGDDR